VILGDSIAVDELLLILKIAFLVLLYLFIWRIVRSASKDIRVPQESFILAPAQAAALGLPRTKPAKLVVLKSPTLKPGEQHELNSAALTIGRSGQNDIQLRGDGFASATHARFEPRGDGIWVHDVGSTNGTFVNGIKLSEPRRLDPGDVVRVGETDLRYDA
jgi:pSer/pThr/pTyr-binding forkhead associated (FHA) protein